MKELHDVLKRPLVTEKSTVAKELANQITFEVSPAANKIEIRRAVEDVFNVRVLDVKTSNVRGKSKRWGKVMGRKPNWKKAVVTLAPGESIEFFEGA